MDLNKQQSRGLFQGSLALICTTLIIFLIIFVVPYQIYITERGALSKSEYSGYVTGVTLAGTALTAFISSSLQQLLAKRFDCKLDSWNGQAPIQPLNNQWRAIMKLDGFLGNFRTIKFHFIYWTGALITTMLAASLSPTTTTREFQYLQKVHDGPSTQMRTVGNCTGEFQLPLQDPSWPYYWDIGDNKVFLVQTKQGDCPTRDAQMVVGNINTFDPDLYAYMDSGVALHKSAMGVPRTMYSPEGVSAPDLDRILLEYSGDLVSTRQCSRVMVRNPISCHPGGSILWGSQWLNVSTDDGHCSAYRRFTEAEWNHYYSAGGGVMIKTMCAHGEIGQGTMVIGAEGGYAHWLAVNVGDLANAPPTQAGSTYVVTCTVDARNSFEYREVSLLLRNTNATQTRYMRYLNATGNSCSGPPILRDVIATAASANWQTLLQQAAGDGWWDLVWQASNTGHGPRLPPYSFTQSTNALEDVLGLVAAMVTARMNSTTTHDINSTALVQATRVGSGQSLSETPNISAPFLIEININALFLLAVIHTWTVARRLTLDLANTRRSKQSCVSLVTRMPYPFATATSFAIGTMPIELKTWPTTLGSKADLSAEWAQSEVESWIKNITASTTGQLSTNGGTFSKTGATTTANGTELTCT
ncbi:Fc.00g033840.m01.CDS01 [Cosmosporella sp. VM-42]